MLSAMTVRGQILKPVKWSYATKITSKTTATIYIKASMENGWHIYAQNLPSGGPTKTTISFTPSNGYALTGKTIEPKPISKYDDSFKMSVHYFEKSVIFQQKINIKTSKLIVKGAASFMSCNQKRCLPEETVSFSIPLKS